MVFSASPTDYMVLLGKHSINEYAKDDQNFLVKKIIMHQNFNEHTYDNDIGKMSLLGIVN